MPRSGTPRDEIRARIVARRRPPGYRPWAHVAIPGVIAVVAGSVAVLFIRDLRPYQLLTLPICFVLFNGVEWWFHYDLLHRRVWRLYDRHTPEHHASFVTEDMAVRSSEEFMLVLVPLYLTIALLPFAVPIPLLLGLAGQRNVALMFFACTVAYSVSYEWLHLLYHMPDTGFSGRFKVVAFLRRHHAIHHSPRLMQRWNFNVTVPLWDLILGTIYRPGVAADGAARPEDASQTRGLSAPLPAPGAARASSAKPRAK